MHLRRHHKTRIAVYDALARGGVMLACNDDGDDSSCTNYTSVQMDVIAARYFVRLGGYSEGGGNVGRPRGMHGSSQQCNDPLPEWTDLDQSEATDITDRSLLGRWNQTNLPSTRRRPLPENRRLHVMRPICSPSSMPRLCFLHDPRNIDCDNYDSWTSLRRRSPRSGPPRRRPLRSPVGGDL